MKIPKYLACIATYFSDDPEIITQYSLVITKTSSNSPILTRYFDLSDYSEDEAADEIDYSLAQFTKLHPDTQVMSMNSPTKLIKIIGQRILSSVTSSDYILLMNRRKKI